MKILKRKYGINSTLLKELIEVIKNNRDIYCFLNEEREEGISYKAFYHTSKYKVFKSIFEYYNLYNISLLNTDITKYSFIVKSIDGRIFKFNYDKKKYKFTDACIDVIKNSLEKCSTNIKKDNIITKEDIDISLKEELIYE